MDRSEIIKRLIDKTGLSMRAFAEKANIPNTTLHSMLTRGIGNASVDNVIKVCKALNITVEDLERMANSNSDDIQTIAAHHDGEDWTEEELAEIEKFKEFIRMKRQQKNI